MKRYYVDSGFSWHVIRDSQAKEHHGPTAISKAVSSANDKATADRICAMFNDETYMDHETRHATLQRNFNVILHERDKAMEDVAVLTGKLRSMQRECDALRSNVDEALAQRATIKAALEATRDAAKSIRVGVALSEHIAGLEKIATDYQRWLSPGATTTAAFDSEANSIPNRLTRIGNHIGDLFERVQKLERKQ